MAPRGGFNINSRTITAPLAAFTMAGLLFVYTRSSISAAKRNAQRHRQADGGQINWENETKRRHGMMETPGDDGKSAVTELLGQVNEQAASGQERIKARLYRPETK